MKKIALVAALVAAAALFVACESTEKAAPAEAAPAAPVAEAAPAASEVLFSGEVEKNKFALANNHQYGINYQFQNTTGQVLPKDYKAKKGDKIKIHIEGTWTKDIVFGKDDHGIELALGCWIVDCSPSANYWTPLSAQWLTKDVVKGGEPWVFDAEFVIEKGGMAKAGSRGADVTFFSADAQAEESVLNTTKFTYEIVR